MTHQLSEVTVGLYGPLLPTLLLCILTLGCSHLYRTRSKL